MSLTAPRNRESRLSEGGSAAQSEPNEVAFPYRWRLLDDPLPIEKPTGFRRLYVWLYDFNRY